MIRRAVSGSISGAASEAANPSRARLCPPIEWRAPPTHSGRPSAAASRSSARSAAISASSLSGRSTVLRATGTGLSRLASFSTSASARPGRRGAPAAGSGTASAAPAAAMKRRRDSIGIIDMLARKRQFAQRVGCRIALRTRQCPIVPRQATRSPRFSPKPDLNTILNGIGDGFYAVDRDWRIILFNREAERHFRRPPEEVLGRKLWEPFPDAAETALGRLFKKTMESRETIRSETESVIFGGRWLSYRLFPLGDGMGIVFRDMTDRKRAEEQRDLLIKELEHRVKNTLTTVQSIASQSFRTAGVGPEALRAFDARLIALGNVHGVLTKQSWDAADLHDVVWAALRPHSAPDRDRFTVDGRTFRSARKARSRSRWRCTSLPPTRSSTAHSRPRPATWTSPGAPRTIASTGNGASAAARRSRCRSAPASARA